MTSLLIALLIALLNLLTAIVRFLDRHGGGWPFRRKKAG